MSNASGFNFPRKYARNEIPIENPNRNMQVHFVEQPQFKITSF